MQDKTRTRGWTPEEDAILREHYPVLGSGVQDRLPHRTVSSIYQRARTLSVSYVGGNLLREGEIPGTTEIALRTHSGTVRAWAIVDQEHADEIDAAGTWSMAVSNGHAYAQSRIPDRKGITMMHRYIAADIMGLDLESGGHVDHANGNGLDNRVANLRTMTAALNTSRHYRRRSHCQSNLPKGVIYSKDRKKYRAQIGHRGMVLSLGTHTSPEQAYAAYFTMKMLIYYEQREALASYPIPTVPLTAYSHKKLRHHWARSGEDPDVYDERLALVLNTWPTLASEES